jgi:signal transduction histidine kinase
MIMNLLDISKGDEGKLAPKRTDVDVAALVGGLVEDLSATAQARGVRLESKVERDTARLDEDLFRRVIMNLLDNAIRHAPADSVVSVTVTGRSGSLDVRVADAGSGVPAELRERVFDPFTQLEGAERSTTRTGRGLGLSFCKVAVEAHGGKIWVEDAAPGAAFCLSIPAER